MVTKQYKEETPVEKPSGTRDPINKVFKAPEPKKENPMVAHAERTPKLSDLPDIYESPNTAAHPASGLVAQKAQHVFDEIEEQSGQVLQKHLLSATGKAVFDDLRLAAQASNKVITELDDGALFQDIINTVKRIQERADEHVPDNASSAAKTVSKQLKSAASTLSHVARLLVTSAEFRNILGSSVDFVSDAIVTWTGKAEDEVEDAAEQGHKAAKDGLDQAKNQVKSGASKGADEVQGKAQQAQSTAHSLLHKGEISDHTKGGLVSKGGNSGSAGDAADDAESAARHVSREAEKYKEDAKEKFSDVKEMASEMTSQAVDTVRGKIENLDISDEDRDRLLKSLKNIVLDIQAHPDYKPALSHLRDMFLRARKTLKPVVKDAVHSTTEDADIKHLESLLEEALSKFARGKDLSVLKKETSSFFAMIEEDKDFDAFFEDVTAFLGKSIEDPSYVEKTDYTKEFNSFIDRGSELLDRKDEYRQSIKKIGKEIRTIGRYISTDPGLQALDASVRSLAKDAFLDEKGRPVIKTELLEDMRRVLPSIIKENLANVPLPRIEHSDADYDFVLDNVILQGDAIVPRYIIVDTRTTLDTTITDSDKAVSMFVRVQLSEMYLSAKDMHFSYKKKSGIHISDMGLLDFSTPHDSKGVKLELLLSPDFTETKRSFRIVESKAEIDSLDIKLHDTQKHTLLYKVFKPIINTVVRKKTEDAICTKMFETIFAADGALQKMLDN